MTGDMNSLADRASAGDAAGAMVAARQLGTTASGLLAYMDSHAPAACYASLYADLHRSLTSWASAADAASIGDWTTATADAQSGTALMNSATDGIAAAAAAACGR